MVGARATTAGNVGPPAGTTTATTAAATTTQHWRYHWHDDNGRCDHGADCACTSCVNRWCAAYYTDGDGDDDAHYGDAHILSCTRSCCTCNDAYDDDDYGNDDSHGGD